VNARCASGRDPASCHHDRDRRLFPGAILRRHTDRRVGHRGRSSAGARTRDVLRPHHLRTVDRGAGCWCQDVRDGSTWSGRQRGCGRPLHPARVRRRRGRRRRSRGTGRSPGDAVGTLARCELRDGRRDPHGQRRRSDPVRTRPRCGGRATRSAGVGHRRRRPRARCRGVPHGHRRDVRRRCAAAACESGLAVTARGTSDRAEGDPCRLTVAVPARSVRRHLRTDNHPVRIREP
jgi:hypothetical protein